MRLFLVGFLTCYCLVQLHSDILGKEKYLEWIANEWNNTHWSLWIWVWILFTFLIMNFTIKIEAA